jgi:hypothetical protein
LKKMLLGISIILFGGFYGVVQWDGSVLMMLIGLIVVLSGYLTKDRI